MSFVWFSYMLVKPGLWFFPKTGFRFIGSFGIYWIIWGFRTTGWKARKMFSFAHKLRNITINSNACVSFDILHYQNLEFWTSLCDDSNDRRTIRSKTFWIYSPLWGFGNAQKSFGYILHFGDLETLKSPLDWFSTLGIWKRRDKKDECCKDFVPTSTMRKRFNRQYEK